MKFILDTNIIFSGIYDLESNAGKILLLAAEDKVELISPIHIRNELSVILIKKLKFSQDETSELISSLPIHWIEQEIYEDNIEQVNKLIAHKKDVPILACALTLGIDIITGDKHFNNIKTNKIKVWKLKDAVEELKKNKG